VNYTLRPATSADREFAIELNRISMRPYFAELTAWNDLIGRAEMERRWAADPYHIIMVSGVRAGFLATVEREGLLILKHIEIVPQFRGQGLGAAIIRELIAKARMENMGVTLYVLKTNPARQLYERLGFTVVEELDTGWRGVKYRMVNPCPKGER
jgi:ribosomal protein S18 acetylase RimI-like enzyme